MGTGKKKIDIEPITDYQSRMVAFTRRRTGLFKKAQKLEEMSGSSIAIAVISETGQPYLHGSPSLLERVLASKASSSASTTTADAGSSTTTATTGSLERFKAGVNSQIEACTTLEEAEIVKRKLLEIKKRADGKLSGSDLQFVLN
ncbi:putative transcription factor MADS-type1 family [Rosa chinensis]|uniref:Putative transcription factor MADS-type1 family n=1 Tax=Rosa chinensis TaxID=74649 RepID=A0A2P6Q302_ROSCH|nr:agamous-like MADS-box protein AGL61 [Rosa chinensis]PRQ28568.1 putative transcription factor MADS-type1 family [Rosa chinensis]